MDDIFDTILKLYGKPGIDTSYPPKLIRNKATGEVRRAIVSQTLRGRRSVGSSRAAHEREGRLWQSSGKSEQGRCVSSSNLKPLQAGQIVQSAFHYKTALCPLWFVRLIIDADWLLGFCAIMRPIAFSRRLIQAPWIIYI